MTADKMQSIARVLSNSSWCRYWLSYTLSNEGQTVMAIQCRDETGKPLPINDAKRHGLEEGMFFIYTALRTHEDGTPYFIRLH